MAVDRPTALLTTNQVEQEYGISRKTLYQWSYNDEGPPRIKYKGLVRYRRRDLERWLDQFTVGGVAP